jgi:hypothetical protein
MRIPRGAAPAGQLGLVHAKAQSRKKRREGVALSALPFSILFAR